MTFAGVGPAVLIGRGNGFSWTTTTGSSDLTDTYVEQLNPENAREYLFRGRWEPMECRTERYAVKDAGELEEQEICRTRHGPIAMFDEANSVAYSVRYGWMDREIGTTRGFWGFNRAEGTARLRDERVDARLEPQHVLHRRQGQLRLLASGQPPGPRQGRRPAPPAGRHRPERVARPAARPARARTPRTSAAAGWSTGTTCPRRAGRASAPSTRATASTTSPTRTTPRAPADPRGGRVRGRKWDFEGLSASLRHAAFADHEYDWFRSALPRARDLKTDLAKKALTRGPRVGRVQGGPRRGRPLRLGRLHADARLDPRAAQGRLRGRARRGRARPRAQQHRAVARLLAASRGTAAPRLAERQAAAAPSPPRRSRRRCRAGAAREFESEDPATWRSKIRLEHYTRLNADLFTDAGLGAACGELEAIFGEDCADQQAQDSGWPGDVPDHIEMDRGTYNHVIEYLTRATRVRRLGGSRVHAGSVIPPGQSGFVSQAGQEGAHFEDQLDDYVNWTYKPMPLSMAELEGQTESTETIPNPRSGGEAPGHGAGGESSRRGMDVRGANAAGSSGTAARSTRSSRTPARPPRRRRSSPAARRPSPRRAGAAFVTARSR